MRQLGNLGYPQGCGPAEGGGPRLAQLRTEGLVRLSFEHRRGCTAPIETLQSGCLRVRTPNQSGDTIESIVLNLSGGLVAGDRLAQHVRWGEDTRALVTTQAAEKVYRMRHSGAVVTTHLDVRRGAIAQWLPRETILFDGARLTRSTDVRLAEDAQFLGCEAVVFGADRDENCFRFICPSLQLTSSLFSRPV